MGFLDNDATFDDGSSPGFTASPQASIALPPVDSGGGDASVAEQVGGGSRLNLSAAGIPPVALATPPPSQTEQEYLHSLPTGQKIGLALQAFSAGVAGRPDPIQGLLKERRAKQAADRADLANTITFIQKGTEILRKMPPGIARDAVANALGEKVGGGELANIFKAVGSQQEEIAAAVRTIADPDVRERIVQAVSGTADPIAEALKVIRNKSEMDRFEMMVDAKRIGTVTKKLTAAIDQAKKTGILDAYKKEDGSFSVPYGKLVELNDKAKIFTPEEMDTIGRPLGQKVLGSLGLKTTKEEEAQAAERGKQSEKPGKEFSEPYTLNGALVQKNLTTGEIRTAVSRAPREPSEELTAAQKFKLRREAVAYDNAQEQMKKFGIGPDGASTDPKVQERLTPTITTKYGSEKNPKFDPQFAGRVKAWTKMTEAGDPREREGINPGGDEGKPKSATATVRPGSAAPVANDTPAKDNTTKAPAAEKPAAKTTLSEVDRTKIMNLANEYLAKGIAPEKIKKMLNDKYGLTITFTDTQKKQ